MKTIIRISLFVAMFATVACEDIIEEDISNDTIQLVSPAADGQIESNVVTFQWAELDGADDYRIQVYSANQSIVLDSLVGRTSFTFPLSQGSYQWRVRGENFAYESTYSFPRNFSVIETDDLTNQQVILTSPQSGLYTNSNSLTCSWQAVDAADTYDFELVNVTNGQTIVYQQAGLTVSSIVLNSTILNQDSEYQWKIKAVNSTSQTSFSSRSFFIDRINPNQPQNILPANNTTQTVNQSIDFSWSIPSDSGAIQSAISYSIEFANDLAFTTIIQTSNTTSLTFQEQFATVGVYYWRIKAKDLSGNNSVYSTPFKFTIN